MPILGLLAVASGWEGWNYHQFCFNLVERDGLLYTALSTAMAPPGWEGMLTNAAPNGPLRGSILEIDPSAAFGHFGLGQSLKQLGQRDEARMHLRLACALAPDSKLYRSALNRLGSGASS